MGVFKRTFSTLLLAALLGGCEPPEIEELTVVPPTVCPGDTVSVRFVSSAFEGGRRTATPTPLAGPAQTLYSRVDTAYVTEQDFQICETTSFLVALWNGDEAACGEDRTACDQEAASVAVGTLSFPFTIDTCDGSDPETAVLEITDAQYGSFVVQEVRNCTGRSRPVQLAGPGGTEDTIDSGAGSTRFSGQSLVGSWMATRNILFPERCPLSFTEPDTRPAPPAICLEFLAGCSPSDVCPGP